MKIMPMQRFCGCFVENPFAIPIDSISGKGDFKMKRARTILIVTDSEDIHSGIGWLLQKRGYRAIEAAGRAVIDHVRQEAPSLVLIDSDHPLSESLALASSLRGKSELADTQIVIVTSQNQIKSESQDNNHVVNRNDSASIMNLLSNLGSVRE